MGNLKAALRFIDRKLEEVVCGICLCAMACSVMLQVVLRYVFSSAAPWAEEIAVYGMIGAVYFGACLAVRERAHIRVGLVYKLLPSIPRQIMVITADLLWLLFLALVFWQSAVYVNFLFNTVYVSPGLGIEQRWPQSLVPLSILLMMVRLIQVYWRWIKGGAKGLPI